MYCSKCGNKMVDGALFCDACGEKIGAAQTAASKNTIVKPVIIGAAAAAVLILLFVIINAAISGISGITGISGKYGYHYYNHPNHGYYAYTIDFNSDGTCMVTEDDYERYSCTYSKNDDGTYTIDFHSIVYGAWQAKREGQDLIISGTGLSRDGKLFEKIG